MSTPFALADALVDDVARHRPIFATFAGIPGHDAEWDDLSPDGEAAFASAVAGWRERVDALPEATDRWSALAVHVLHDWIDAQLDAAAHRDHEVALNTIDSPFQHVRMVFDTMDAGWSDAVARLETLDRALAGYRRSLEAGLEGRPVAARQVRGAIAQGRVHAGEGSFFRTLPARFAASGVADPLRERLEAAVPRACAAYAAFTDWLEVDYLPRARTADPVGRDRYVRAMRRWLGASPDPEETCAWGWSEVRRILGEVQRLAPGRSVVEAMRAVKADPVAPDRASFLAAMTDRQRRAFEVAAAHFDVPEPIRRLDVKEAPPGGPPGAYYMAPSEDLSRPGTVWYARPGDGPFPLYDEVSTAYHEGFPGHHLQVATQVGLTRNLSRLHRVAYGYSGFAEGWALYAEKLMAELGAYERPEYELGRLANELIRACRVVFDVGAHLDLPIPADAPFHPGERWTFELGVELLRDLGGLSPERAASEVTRYLGWPGQAISYKVGERAILALREEFLGAGGTLRDFHARVLGCGNVGLDRLREQVIT